MINVGIIGCGSIAKQRHAYEYSIHPQVKIAGFFDLEAKRAQALADKFDTKVYKTMEEMLADPNIDAVSVCTANTYHAACTIAALESGKHVLCEKPMATSWEDCVAMMEAAKKAGKRLMIGQNQRLAPAHAKAKKILESGELGRVISFQSTFGHKGPEMWSVDQSANTWFFKKNLAAFGSMADLGIHKIDLMRYLIGGKVTAVYAKLMTLDKKFPDGNLIEVDDNAVLVLTFGEGAMGTITTSWTHYGEECNATTIYCEKGIISMYKHPNYALDITYEDGTKALFELEKLQTNDDAQQRSSQVIDTFIGGILSGQPTILDAEAVIDSMRVVFACLQSSQDGKIVNLG